MQIKLLFIGLLLLIYYNSIAQPKERIFVIEPSMIQSFDSLTFEIELTDSAKVEFNKTDFSNYSFLWYTSSYCLFPLIESTMSYRPTDIYVSRRNRAITKDLGKIKIEVSHLSENDCRILDIKRTFLNSVKSK